MFKFLLSVKVFSEHDKDDNAPEGKAAPPSSPPAPTCDSPPRARQPSPHLQDIAEEDSTELQEEPLLDDEPTTLQPLGARVSYKKRRNVQSPSPTLSVKAARKSQRTRSVTSTTSSDTSSGAQSGTIKMQAEQGSIGDLQRYHNRYLKNRRHTLANVR
ncbi:hypothetical protein FQR65_LT03487 [Abscondita terminalis]|nr:hypothetical protein FQR65_LT03487 [Abscondita terminalis]